MKNCRLCKVDVSVKIDVTANIYCFGMRPVIGGKLSENKYQNLEVSYSTELKKKDDLVKIIESRALEMMEK